MKRSLTMFLLVLYTPIFLGIFMGHDVKFNLLIYVTMVLLVFSIGTKPKPSRYFLGKIKPMFHFCLSFIVLLLIQSYYKGVGLRFTLDILVQYSLCLTFMLYLACHSKDFTIQFLEKVFYAVGVMFLIQLVLSGYESINNMFFDAAHAWVLPSSEMVSIRKRWLLQVVGIDFPFLDYFKHSFSGLLGQQNHWAVQLAFYNLIFLYMYNKTKGKYFLFLVVLVLVAVLFNTTRAAIFAILVTDLLYFGYFGRSTKLKAIVFSGVVISVLMYGGEVIDNFLLYLAQTDTLSGRIQNYLVLTEYVFTSEFPFLMGYDVPQLLAIEYRFLSNWGFESLFFDVLFANGIFGLFLFVQFVVRVARQGRKVSGRNKYFNFLIVFNIVAVSLTLGDLMLAPHTLPFVALIYIYNVITDPSYNGTETVRTAFSNYQHTNQLKPGILHA